ncbi:MAG: hypothetical protein EP338_09425 [Bacteroidetes bacterium]|nr:MAG: hypothetical protein EP338_09425 [Bacteroidota bacterium]
MHSLIKWTILPCLLLLGCSEETDKRELAIRQMNQDLQEQKSLLQEKYDVTKKAMYKDQPEKYVFSFIWLRVGGMSVSQKALLPAYDVSRFSEIKKTATYSKDFEYHFLDSVETILRREKHSTIRGVVQRKCYVFDSEADARREREKLRERYKSHF